MEVLHQAKMVHGRDSGDVNIHSLSMAFRPTGPCVISRPATLEIPGPCNFDATRAATPALVVIMMAALLPGVLWPPPPPPPTNPCPGANPPRVDADRYT